MNHSFEYMYATSRCLVTVLPPTQAEVGLIDRAIVKLVISIQATTVGIIAIVHHGTLGFEHASQDGCYIVNVSIVQIVDKYFLLT